MSILSTATATGANEATGSSPILLVLLLLLAVCAGIIVLQVYLSKQESKWGGLVLPIVSFGISLMALLAVLLFSTNTGTMIRTENGEIVEQTADVISETSSIIVSSVYIFLLCNIPTVILLVIYAACRGKRNRQHALEKMSIQDLE